MEIEKNEDKQEFEYLINKPLYKTKLGELFLVTNKLKPNDNTLYIMKRIKVKTKEEKTNILNEIKKIKAINSKYLIKIYDYFIEKINEDEVVNLILDFCDENNCLEKIVYNSSFLTSQNIWRIFILLLLEIKLIHQNNIIFENLTPKNIFIDKKKYIKIGGLGNILDLSKEEVDFSLYKSPEILSGEKCDKKNDMWSLGCILYEMVFKKRPFDNNKNIIGINYEIPENREKDIKNIIGKLLCKPNSRIEAEKMFFDPVFKKKIIEYNLFFEIIQNNIEDFNHYFYTNAGIFEPNAALNKLKNIEYYEYPFYLKCKNCNNPPEIILNDKENIIISCNKCSLSEKEKIENLCNYSSDWITNEIIIPCYKKHTYNDFTSNQKYVQYFFDMINKFNSFFVEKDKEGYIKMPSIKYCKKCDIYLCEECLKKHEKNISHEMLELYNAKFNYCNKHNKNFKYYCHKCDKNLCNICYKEHTISLLHIFEKPEKNIQKLKKDNSLENLIDNSENMKVNKYGHLYKNIIWLQNFNKDNKESKKFLNNILNKIIQLFYEDLKTSINLVNFAKILFSTSKIFYKDNEKIKQYNTIIEVIKKYFSLEKLKEFNEILLQEKNKYISICNTLTKDETQKLKNNINKMFEQKKQYASDSEKTKDFIKDNMEYSTMIKRYVTKEKIEHPENYINIDNTINYLDNYSKGFIGNNDYVLSLLGKSVENNGIEMNISKKKDENFDKIELASIQSIFTLSDQKKYELHFDFGDEENEKIRKDPYKKNEFITNYTKKIAKELKIKPENIILTDVHHGSLGVDLSIVNEGKKGYNDVKNLEGKLNMKVKEKPLLEMLQISPEILDARGNNKGYWGQNEKRGGEKYIPPLQGWEGIGLKVWGQYDNGNNDWLNYNNNSKEYAIAYYGLNNHLDDKNLLASDLNIYANDIKKLNTDNFYQDQINERGNGQKKCGEGICLYQDPNIAENTARIIEIPGYGIFIKLILMCRVKPNKIRQPKKFSGFWILNPTPDEIRPYRILFKKVVKSSLGDSHLKFSIDPVHFIINILKSNNFIFYDFAKDSKYHDLAYINGQKLNNDNFILRFYTSNYYRFLNNYLRDKKVEEFSEEQIKSFACCLQLALSRNKGIQENTIVYRGINLFKFPQEIKKGSKFYLNEFMSTTTNINVAKSFMRDIGTLMEIKIQNNGTNNYLNYCYDVQKISCYPREDEILLSSHCCFIVEQITRGELFDYVRMRCEGFII